MSSPLAYTPLDQIASIREQVKNNFRAGALKSIAFRKKQILGLAYMIKDHRQAFHKALRSDLNRPPHESDLFELNGLLNECVEAYHSVDGWAKTENATFNPMFIAMSPKVRKEAKGVVLMIGPFNFPVWCLLCPLIGAIAAGNAAVLKPSEQSPATATLIAELLPKYLDEDLYKVVNGSVAENTKLLELQWDHIFYTGSGRVGQIISLAAAKHLTPVSLELGGKSPVIVDPSCDANVTARRVLWAKTCNAGQICIAPDYVIVPRHFQDTFVKALEAANASFYPASALESDSYSRIISQGQLSRLKGLLNDTKGKIVFGGDVRDEEKYMQPTVVRDVGVDDSLMSQELFGPILPIVPVEDLDEAIEYINSKDTPLAIYLFANDSKVKEKVASQTQSGCLDINDTIMHGAAQGLPFGGVGPSGSGYHRGKFGFDLFTHSRATIDSPGWLDLLLGARYPPYTAGKIKVFSMMLEPSLPARDGSGGWSKYAFATAMIGAALAIGKQRGLDEVLKKWIASIN